MATATEYPHPMHQMKMISDMRGLEDLLSRTCTLGLLGRVLMYSDSQRFDSTLNAEEGVVFSQARQDTPTYGFAMSRHGGYMAAAQRLSTEPPACKATNQMMMTLMSRLNGPSV